MSIPIYLGGSHEDDLCMYKCLRIGSQTVVDVYTSDDGILLHINHATCTESFKRVIVASPDTDVLVLVPLQ